MSTAQEERSHQPVICHHTVSQGGSHGQGSPCLAGVQFLTLTASIGQQGPRLPWLILMIYLQSLITELLPVLQRRPQRCAERTLAISVRAASSEDQGIPLLLGLHLRSQVPTHDTCITPALGPSSLVICWVSSRHTSPISQYWHQRRGSETQQTRRHARDGMNICSNV